MKATPQWQIIKVLGVDIDGTLTDGFLYWAGPDAGWTQRYSVRDGEAILRLTSRAFHVIPISRNKTRCAKVRMEGLKLPTDWVGVSDKDQALDEMCSKYGVSETDVCYIGDGREDAPILSRVGLGCSVANGHPKARDASAYVTQASGGNAAVEEVIECILASRGWLE